jgi:hypothetical protein
MKKLNKNILPALVLLISTLTYSNNNIEDLADRISKNDSFDKLCWNIAGLNLIRVSSLSVLTEEEQKLNIEKVSALAPKLNDLSDGAIKEEFATLTGFSNLDDFNFATGIMEKNLLNLFTFFPELKLLDKETLEQTLNIAVEKWESFAETEAQKEKRHKALLKCADNVKNKEEACNRLHSISKWVLFSIASVACVAALVAAGLGTLASLGSTTVAVLATIGACSGLLTGILGVGAAAESTCATRETNGISQCTLRYGTLFD